MASPLVLLVKLLPCRSEVSFVGGQDLKLQGLSIVYLIRLLSPFDQSQETVFILPGEVPDSLPQSTPPEGSSVLIGLNEARGQGRRIILRYDPRYLGNNYNPLNEPESSLFALEWEIY
jgi:hypothetical protein